MSSAPPNPALPAAGESAAEKLAPTQIPEAAAGGPPFDITSLRLSQDFTTTAGVKKAVLTVPMRKPSRQAFIRVRPGEEWRFQTAVLEDKDERETYVVGPSLWAALSDLLVPKVLYCTIDRQGVLALWPVRLPGPDGRLDEWNRSAHKAADLATRRWVSVRASMALGAYEVIEATGQLPEPAWPDLTMDQILSVAFKDRRIGSIDHPVLRRLRGEA